MEKFKGIIIEESLEDNRALNGLEVTGLHITAQEDPAERWRLVTVLATHADIKRLSGAMKPGWYMHFWNSGRVIVAYHDKLIEFDQGDHENRRLAVEYGLSEGIPGYQLDFPIDEYPLQPGTGEGGKGNDKTVT